MQRRGFFDTFLFFLLSLRRCKQRFQRAFVLIKLLGNLLNILLRNGRLAGNVDGGHKIAILDANLHLNLRLTTRTIDIQKHAVVMELDYIDIAVREVLLAARTLHKLLYVPHNMQQVCVDHWLWSRDSHLV